MKEKLIMLGLSEREADAYLALLDSGEATATQLSKLTKEHRTNIYDSLDGLIKKGIVVYMIKNDVKFFSATEPENILNYSEEMTRLAADILPELNKRFLKKKEDKPIVEVYEGSEGFKTILNKILKEGKTIYGIGASEEWEKRFPFKLAQYMKEREKRKIKANLLYVKGTKIIKHRLNHVRFLPSESTQPSTIAIFGDYTAIFMWTTPLVATLTRSAQLSHSFKKYFEILWAKSRNY